MTTMPWSELIKDAEAGGAGEPVPEGSYRAEITKAEAKAATTGKNMIVCAFKILDGPYAGRPLYNNFVLTPDNPNALAWFFKNMASLGIGKEFFAMNPSLESVAAQLVGKRAVLSVSVRTYNNELRNDVKGVTADTGAPAPAQAPTPSAPAEATAPQEAAVTPPQQAPAGGAPNPPF